MPGKKTDVCDAQWLQQLHAAGLLKKSFRPAKDIVPLRYVMRHRSELIAEAGRHTQLMQKVLTEMNLHLHHVFSAEVASFLSHWATAENVAVATQNQSLIAPRFLYRAWSSTDRQGICVTQMRYGGSGGRVETTKGHE